MASRSHSTGDTVVDDVDTSLDIDGLPDLSEDDDATTLFDLSAVDEKPKFELLDAGLYEATILDVSYGLSRSSSKPMLTWQFQIITEPDVHGKTSTRRVYWWTTLDERGLPQLKRTLLRIAPELANKRIDAKIVGNELTDLSCRVRVVQQVGNDNTTRNVVKDVLAAETAVDSIFG